MTTINVAAVDGNAIPFVMRGEDLGSGTADSTAGKVVALHRHDAILKAAFDSLNAIGLTKNYYSASISASGDNTAITSPGSGLNLSIAWIRLANESATEVTVLLKSGVNQIFRAVLAPKGTAGQSAEMSFPVHCPLEVATNTALVASLSAAVAVGISAGYHIKS